MTYTYDPLADALARMANLRVAEAAITGVDALGTNGQQSYSFAQRSGQRAELRTIHAEIARLEKRIAKLSKGGIRVRSAFPI